MIKDTEFYNKESVRYSEKRYPKKPTHYTQFFFVERLRCTIEALKKEISSKTDLSLLEIGCADGVVIHDIKNKFPNTFSQLIGIDISPGMIDAAKEKFSNEGIEFALRSAYTDIRKHDVIVEIGVINYTSLTDELDYIAEHLKNTGVAIISLAGTKSLWDKRRDKDTGFQTFLSYEAYETEIKKYFTLEKTIPVGLPIPGMWRLPVVGRISSKMIETMLRPLAPNLFHEKMYVLKLKEQLI